MRGRSNFFVAKEGVPFLLLTFGAAAFSLVYLPWWVAALPALVFAFLVLLFRDPIRDVPPVALGVISPVDGEVVEVDTTDRCVVQGEAHRIRIRINSFGTYTARSPVEGQIMNLRSKTGGVESACPTNALWVQTDEGSSVVLQFHDYPFGLAPRALANFGERIGQGQRCAVIRLARYAEIYMPINGKVYVEPGQIVAAGTDLIGAVPPP